MALDDVYQPMDLDANVNRVLRKITLGFLKNHRGWISLYGIEKDDIRNSAWVFYLTAIENGHVGRKAYAVTANRLKNWLRNEVKRAGLVRYGQTLEFIYEAEADKDAECPKTDGFAAKVRVAWDVNSVLQSNETDDEVIHAVLEVILKDTVIFKTGRSLSTDSRLRAELREILSEVVK